MRKAGFRRFKDSAVPDIATVSKMMKQLFDLRRRPLKCFSWRFVFSWSRRQRHELIWRSLLYSQDKLKPLFFSADVARPTIACLKELVSENVILP